MAKPITFEFLSKQKEYARAYSNCISIPVMYIEYFMIAFYDS